MLSNSCLVLPAVVKQQQENISRNHIPSLFAVSVHVCMNKPKQISEEHDRDVLVLGAVNGEPAHVDNLDELQDLSVDVLVGSLAPLRSLGSLLKILFVFVKFQP